MLSYDFYSVEQSVPFREIHITASELDRLFRSVLDLYIDRGMHKKTSSKRVKAFTDFINFVRKYADSHEVIALRAATAKWKSSLHADGYWRYFGGTYYILEGICDTLIAIDMVQEVKNVRAERNANRKSRRVGGYPAGRQSIRVEAKRPETE